MSDINHTNTPCIVCPWCGTKTPHDYRFPEWSQMNCDKCCKDFECVQTVTYTTAKVGINNDHQ